MNDIEKIAYESALEHIRKTFPGEQRIPRSKVAKYLQLDPYKVMAITSYLKRCVPKGAKTGYTSISPENLALIKLGY